MARLDFAAKKARELVSYIDPTGITSWPELEYAYNTYQNNKNYHEKDCL